MYKLHKDGLPYMINQMIVEEKQQFTVRQLAKKLKISKASVQGALTILRKRGILIHPVGGSFNPFLGTGKRGVLVDSTDDKEYFLEVNERYKTNINAQLNTHLTGMEKAWKQYPELRDNIEKSLEQVQMKLLEEKQQLRQITQGNENTRN